MRTAVSHLNHKYIGIWQFMIFCARITPHRKGCLDDTPISSFGTVPIVPISAPKDKFKVVADISAVQDLWCLSTYKLSNAEPMLTLPDSAFAMSVLATLMDISNVKL